MPFFGTNLEQTVRLKITFAGQGDLIVDYRPLEVGNVSREAKTEVLDPPAQNGSSAEAFAAEVQAFEEAKDRRYREFFARVVASWDYYQSQEDYQAQKPVALTIEGLAVVPLMFLRHIMDEIIKDFNQGEHKGTRMVKR